MKQITYYNGTVLEIDDLLHIERNGIPDLFKRVLVFRTDDGQEFYPELRNQRLKMLEREQITEGSKVVLGITLEGSQKNGKRYNNIYINSIKKVEE